VLTVTVVRNGTAATTDAPRIIQSNDSPTRQIRPGADAAVLR
jgi:hypothetical protein